MKKSIKILISITILSIIISSCKNNQINYQNNAEEDISSHNKEIDSINNINYNQNIANKAESEDIDDEYILYDSNTKLLTPEDIKTLSIKEIRLAINEIYARHGRKFNNEEYKI